MRGPYGTRWADIDEPPEVVEAEDARFIAALGRWNVAYALRPPEDDEDLVPGTFRAQWVELWRAEEAAMAALLSTRRGRFLWRAWGLWSRLRRR